MPYDHLCKVTQSKKKNHVETKKTEITSQKTDLSKPDIPCHKAKYHPSADIINFRGFGVKVSYAILDIFRVTRTTVS
jgi:hypothetical protein